MDRNGKVIKFAHPNVKPMMSSSYCKLLAISSIRVLLLFMEVGQPLTPIVEKVIDKSRVRVPQNEINAR